MSTPADSGAVAAEATELLRRGELADAQVRFEAALAADEASLEAMIGLGRIAAQHGDAPPAIAWFERVLDRDPGNATAAVELARLLAQAGRGDEARDALWLAAHHHPDCGEAWLQLGRFAADAGRTDEAIDCLERARAAMPERSDPEIELGRVFQQHSRWSDAVECYRKALERGPCGPQVYSDLASSLVPLQRNEEALAIFAKLCAQYPWSNVARIGLANVLLQIGRFDEALAEYETILAREPRNYYARWHRSLILLQRGRFDEGWAGYDARLLAGVESLPRPFPFPRWRGEPLAGKAVLVYSEQGVGDEIMFASCYPELIAAAGRVIIECRAKLAPLFARSFPEATVVTTEDVPVPVWMDRLRGVDCHVPSGSLPPVFRTALERFPRTAYLRADPVKLARWRARLASLGPGLKVGISWRGGSVRTRSAVRSVALSDWARLLELRGCHFVNLQYGETAADLAALSGGGAARVHHWQEAVDDYDETAALVCALDLVVTVCTALVHLSGALGQRAWVLVPTVPEWRYGLSGSRMPWYGSVELVRQPPGEAWAPTVDRVAERLAALARDGRPGAGR